MSAGEIRARAKEPLAPSQIAMIGRHERSAWRSSLQRSACTTKADKDRDSAVVAQLADRCRIRCGCALDLEPLAVSWTEQIGREHGADVDLVAVFDDAVLGEVGQVALTRLGFGELTPLSSLRPGPVLLVELHSAG